MEVAEKEEKKEEEDLEARLDEDLYLVLFYISPI